MMIQRKGTANGFTTYNNQFLLNAGTHRWSDGASTTKHSFVSQRLLDGRWPPASTIKDKNQGYSLSEPAGSVSLEQTVTHTHTHTTFKLNIWKMLQGNPMLETKGTFLNAGNGSENEKQVTVNTWKCLSSKVGICSCRIPLFHIVSIFSSFKLLRGDTFGAYNIPQSLKKHDSWLLFS